MVRAALRGPRNVLAGVRRFESCFSTNRYGMFKQIVLKPKINHDTFGCDKKYFDRYIRDKPLKIVKRYNTMLRVKDARNEEWSVFKDQYVVKTGGLHSGSA